MHLCTNLNIWPRTTWSQRKCGKTPTANVFKFRYFQHVLIFQRHKESVNHLIFFSHDTGRLAKAKRFLLLRLLHLHTLYIILSSSLSFDTAVIIKWFVSPDSKVIHVNENIFDCIHISQDEFSWRIFLWKLWRMLEGWLTAERKK